MRVRYRKYRTLKTALLFLIACFLCGVLLHTRTDNARNESRRNSRCGNAPWCLEDVEDTGQGPKIPHINSPQHQQQAKDAVRNQEHQAVLDAVRNNNVNAIDGIIRKDDPLLDRKNLDEARILVDMFHHDNAIPKKDLIDKVRKQDPVLDRKHLDVERRLVDKFNPGNLDNALPKKDLTVKRESMEGMTKVGDAEHRPVQVAPPRDAVADASGPGELGKPFVVSDADKNESTKLFGINSFNLFASDRISLNRTLPDVRPEGCSALTYPNILPKTSLIIVFHNEAWSALWRTVHSAINRSPPCLQEVILVDDASTQGHLKSKLDRHAQEVNFDIKVLHLEKRSGLTVARLKGADVATGEILVFLDSHCECTKGWLEPLAYRIDQDRANVVVPVIDVIDDDNLEYLKGDGVPQIGGFSWGLLFNWQGMQQPDKVAWNKNKTIPIRSPTMAGGLFAIDKGFFNKIGRYDEGFKVWGGENLELSFKTWMCGGSLETMPCSHVGHIFRHRAPYSSGGAGNFMLKNNKRLAEVWLDQYKNFFYYFNPNVRKADAGDISDRLAIRERLKCKSFGWFLENIFPESHWPTKDSIFGQEEPTLRGFFHAPNGTPGCILKYWEGLEKPKIRNVETHQCVDTMMHKAGHKAGMFACHGQGGTQIWALMRNNINEIRHEDACLDVSQGGPVMMLKCHGQGGNQEWTYDERTKVVKHTSGLCLDISDKSREEPSVKPCNGGKTQQWDLNAFD